HTSLLVTFDPWVGGLPPVIPLNLSPSLWRTCLPVLHYSNFSKEERVTHTHPNTHPNRLTSAQTSPHTTSTHTHTHTHPVCTLYCTGLGHGRHFQTFCH